MASTVNRILAVGISVVDHVARTCLSAKSTSGKS